MNQKKSDDRKKTFGIRTSKMSEEVYAHLEKKSSKNELAQYIIGLVEKDLNQREMELDFKELTKEVLALKRQFQLIEKVSVKDSTKNISIDRSYGELEVVSDEDVNPTGFSESTDFSDF